MTNESSLAASSEVIIPSHSAEEDFLSFADQENGVVSSASVPGIAEKENGEVLPPENIENPLSERKEIIRYEIKEGDTISSIAASFGLKTQTLLWANDLQERSIIKPGDLLDILPKDGLMYKVKKGDTLGAITQTYKSDVNEIIAFNNNLDSDQIVAGEEIFLPGGIMPPPPAPKPKPKTIAGQDSFQPPTVLSRRPAGSGCNGFPYGYCTYYVAQKRCVTWRGDAKYWLANAQAQGYSVCWGNSSCEPAPGAIMVTNENSRWGHVVYVEAVDDNKVTISEMNRFGFGKTSRRVLNKNDWIIRGYIY